MKKYDLNLGADLEHMICKYVFGWEYKQYSPDYLKYYCLTVGDGHGWWRRPGEKHWDCAACSAPYLDHAEMLSKILEEMHKKDLRAQKEFIAIVEAKGGWLGPSNEIANRVAKAAVMVCMREELSRLAKEHAKCQSS